MRRGRALRHPDRSAPRLGLRFAVGTGHLCQIKFWLMQLKTPPAYLSMALSITCPTGSCSASHLRRLFLLPIGGKFKGYFPNVLGVLADGPVGGEPRHSCDVEHARASPIEGRQPQPFDASLHCVISIEIHCDHVIVGMPQRIHEGSKSVSIVG